MDQRLVISRWIRVDSLKARGRHFQMYVTGRQRIRYTVGLVGRSDMALEVSLTECSRSSSAPRTVYHVA